MSQSSVKKSQTSVKKWKTSEKSNKLVKKCHKLVFKKLQKWQTIVKKTQNSEEKVTN